MSGWQQYLPVGELVFNDPSGTFDSAFNVTDGAPVTISVGMSQQAAQQYNFRVLKPGIDTILTGTQVRLVLYWDNPMYWGQTINASFNGNSSDVLTAIAASTGLRYQIDTTNDQQVWIPGNARYCQFAAFTAKAGWVDASSLMLLGVTLTNELRYKNVGAYTYRNAFKVKLDQLTSTGGYLPAVSWEQHSVSGYQNFKGAYHQAQQNQSLMATDGIKETLTTVQKQRMAQYLSMNKDVKQLLDAGRKMHYTTIDVGNTHPNYHAAMYQNTRLQRTMVNRTSFVTMIGSGIDLFDQMDVELFRPPTGKLSTGQLDINGNYFVIGKTIHVGPQAIYCEKFSLVRDSHNISPVQSDV